MHLNYKFFSNFLFYSNCILIKLSYSSLPTYFVSVVLKVNLSSKILLIIDVFPTPPYPTKIIFTDLLSYYF